MYKIMSNQYVFSGNEYVEGVPTILVEENVWNGEHDNSEEDFTGSTENTLTENFSETYVTCDGNNTTQYFSIDASNESLTDISNVSIDNSRIGDATATFVQEQENGNESVDLGGQQVVLFRIDDSDDLYGVQVGQDEDGNLQKYQFKVRQNEEGNLEAVPESLQILPLDGESEGPQENEEMLPTEEMLPEEEVAPMAGSPTVFVKQEHAVEQLHDHDIPNEEEEEGCEEDDMYQEHVDTKEGILEVAAPTVIQKQEVFDPADTLEEPEHYREPSCEHYFDQPPEDLNDENLEENLQEPDYYVNEDPPPESEPVDTVVETSGHYEQLFVKESHLIVEENGVHHEELAEEISVEPAFCSAEAEEDEEEAEEEEESRESRASDENNESDNEDYEVVDGVHVTGDIDEQVEELQANNIVRKTLVFHEQLVVQSPRTRRVHRNVIRKIRASKVNSAGKDAMYYFVQHPEKENVGEFTGNVVLRPNPRSILKCSLASAEPKKDVDEEKYEKRFAKSKEAQQARQFHNFIAQTKIIHAPVRNERLPRKQKIKPMERTDEEIVVQEVFVSSNGMFQPALDNGPLRDRASLKPIEFIQLTDSDEDYDPKVKNKRKRRHRKRKSQRERTTSDSGEEWSDISVIEIDESDDSDVEEAQHEAEEVISPAKRFRGRQSKKSAVDSPPDGPEKGGGAQKEINGKRPRGRPPKAAKNLDSRSANGEVEKEVILIKTNNKCPKCPKSFPSEGSLRTHMQYHNFSQPQKNLPSTSAKTVTVKYQCEICGDTFKNNFLLTRHVNSHKDSKNVSCAICKKVFNDISQLSNHKRTHVKEQMFKTTTVPKVTPPKKAQPKRVSPRRSPQKCKDCGKIVSSSSLLAIHMRTHKRFTCGTCKAKFLSNIMLQNHIRQKCVKSRTPKKRLSFGVRKCLRKPPSRISTRQSSAMLQVPAAPKVPEPVTRTMTVTNIKCDSCPMTFATYTSLFKHKVVKHGLETPDRPVTRHSSYKPQGTPHGGIPPNEKLRSAFTELKRKLE